MNKEAAMVPGAHFINQSIGNAVIISEHSKYFFAEDNVGLAGVDIKQSMRVGVGFKFAINNKPVHLKAPLPLLALE